MNRKTIFSLAKKEFLSYFNSPTGYILIVPFLLLTFFLYFRSALLTNEASLRPFFDLLPYMLLLIAPAVAMRTFAQEQKNKTLELLFAHPISELEIVLAKFFGSFGFYFVMLLTTISLPVTTFIFSNPDPGVVIAQYLGALFVGGAFLSIGIAASALTSSQVSSFLLSAAITFGFILVGFDIVLLSLPKEITALVTQVAILPHMNNISRGVLDLRDLLYFVTLIGLFLMIAVIKLSQRKTTENPAAQRRLHLGLGLIVGIGVVANILMYSYPLRLDLTFNRIFTISKGTKQTLTNLPDIVTINLYTSTNLPGPVATNVRKVRDTLRDYHVLGKGKIMLVERQPDAEEDDLSYATEDGIQEVQFNTLANNAFAVQKGYFGLSLYYGDKKETIPYMQNVDDLEYQLTRLIRKMTSEQKPTLAVYAPADTKYSPEKSITILQENLDMQYELQDVALEQPEATVSANALLVYGLTEALSATASGKISEYIQNGGNIILLLENHKVDPQVGSATAYNTGLEGLLSDFGLTVNKDIVFDTRLNETITLNAGQFNYLMQYPFWIRAIPTKEEFPALSGINSVTLTWANSFSTEKIEGVTLTPLLQTSLNGGKQSGVYTIAPNQLKPDTFKPSRKEELVAVAGKKGNSKFVVVGDSDFILDQFVQNTQQNLDFASSIIDWVAADEAIASIKRKTGDSPVFTFTSATQVKIVQYTNQLLVPVMVVAFGIWYLRRRRILTRRTYTT